MSAFLSGLCPHCGSYWMVPAEGHRRQVYCSDKCRKDAYKVRAAARAAAQGTRDQPAELNARMLAIEAKVKSGELSAVPGNCCPACVTKVTGDSDPLTGRTIQSCKCGTTYIVRWAA